MKLNFSALLLLFKSNEVPIIQNSINGVTCFSLVVDSEVVRRISNSNANVVRQYVNSGKMRDKCLSKLNFQPINIINKCTYLGYC